MTGPGPFLLRTFIHPQCLAAASLSPPTPALPLYRAFGRLWAHKLKLNQAQQVKGEAAFNTGVTALCLNDVAQCKDFTVKSKTFFDQGRGVRGGHRGNHLLERVPNCALFP